MEHPHVKLVGTMRLGPKGQVVIPADVREAMGVQPGDKMIALYAPDKCTIAFTAESKMQCFIDQMGSHIEDLRTQIDTNEKQ